MAIILQLKLSKLVLFWEIWAFLVAQMVKNPPAMWETWLPSLGWEDPLEEGMATYSSILAREFHGQWSLAGYSPKSLKELGTIE